MSTLGKYCGVLWQEISLVAQHFITFQFKQILGSYYYMLYSDLQNRPSRKLAIMVYGKHPKVFGKPNLCCCFSWFLWGMIIIDWATEQSFLESFVLPQAVPVQLLYVKGLCILHLA